VIILQTIAVALVLYAVFIVGIPWLILTSTREVWWLWLPLGPLRWLGPIAIGFGLYLYIWALVHLMRRETSAIPAVRPTVLDTSGWYARMRHPLLAGVVAILLGEAVTAQSLALLAYALAYWAWLHAFVTRREEPQLRQAFGQAYADYAAQVPRWLPWRAARRRRRGDAGGRNSGG
jgi:protein-S-isoprenylcysteine O-methyltransferase Ste14